MYNLIYRNCYMYKKLYRYMYKIFAFNFPEACNLLSIKKIMNSTFIYKVNWQKSIIEELPYPQRNCDTFFHTLHMYEEEILAIEGVGFSQNMIYFKSLLHKTVNFFFKVDT